MRLFVERARAVKADFVLDAANAEAVAQVCRRLDGVPLAIELAAARVAAMNPGELARRLDRRFRLLAGGERGAIERHQTLRATIDWSYDLLSRAEQRLLDRLWVFAGGCTLDAAEAVCAGDPIDADDVFELVADLVARSLVVADDRASTPVTGCWRPSANTARNASPSAAKPTGSGRPRRSLHRLRCHATPKMYGPGQLEWGARLAASTTTSTPP